MAVIESKSYKIECDVCGETFEDSCTGFSIFADKGDAIDNAQDDGWWYLEYDDDKCYCPDCHYIDESDRLYIRYKCKE